MKEETKLFFKDFIEGFLSAFLTLGMSVICGYLSFKLFMLLFNNKILSSILGVIVFISYLFALIEAAIRYNKRRIQK
jgi:hypothetical protein